MIRTYLKCLILDKFINKLFDGFIDMFHKPIISYTKDDFYVGQPIHKLIACGYNYKLDNAYVTSVIDNVVSVYCDRIFIDTFYGMAYINSSYIYTFTPSDVTEFN